MNNLLKKLVKMTKNGGNHADPLINISISKSALYHNLDQFRRITPNSRVVPVLKSNAYGHGIFLIANELEKKAVSFDIPFFVIDSYFEAQALRNEGIKTPLLIIGYVRPENINNSKLKNISYVIGSIDSLKQIKTETRVHLKIDTGMRRQGILPEEKDSAIKIIKENKNIILQGICSHFADADNLEQTFTKRQIEIWNKCVEIFKEQFPTLKYWHISATEGHIYKDVRANITRLGIGLYGLTEIDDLQLKPVMEMKTIISVIKKIKKGETIGYSRTFTADHNMTIATIPVGYYEGVDRKLSNKGVIKVGNKFCKIVGRVSMNITIIDITGLNIINIDDEVTVISKIKQDKNSIENIAKECGTISYEIAVHIPQHLKRILTE